MLNSRITRSAFLASLAGGLALPKTGKKAAETSPTQGVKTPGVQIPFSRLTPETEIALKGRSTGLFVFEGKLHAVTAAGVVERFDLKTSAASDALPGFTGACGGGVVAFGSVWVPSCSAQGIVRLTSKTGRGPMGGRGGMGGRGVMGTGGGDGKAAAETKPTTEAKPKAEAKPATETVAIATGIGTAAVAIAATADSIWVLTDDRTTLSRIDPETNAIVSELRLPAGCNTVQFGEGALWVTAPTENRLLKIDPLTNLVTERIEVPAQPTSIAFGASSIWVLCQAEGKVVRVDPKTNKVTATVELSIKNATGRIAFGENAVWATVAGFPLTRIDPLTDKVAQQFWGGEAENVAAIGGAIWLTRAEPAALLKFDPKRILATLAE